MVRNRWLGALLLGVLLLCGLQPRASAAFAQFNITTDPNISVIGNPCAEAIWLNPAQAQIQPSANGYYCRFDFQFVGTDIQFGTYVSGTSGWIVRIDGNLISSAGLTAAGSVAGSMPGTTMNQDISLVNGAARDHSTNNGAGFVNTTGVLSEGTHACTIMFPATSGNTNTYFFKLFQVQGANPQLLPPSYTASSAFFPAHTFPQYIGGSAPVSTQAAGIPSYIRTDDTSGFTGGGNNAILQPQKPVGALHFRTNGGTAISIGKWSSGISGFGQQVITVAIDNQVLPEIDLKTAGVTGNPYDWIPLATGLANVDHDVDITYSIAGSATPGIGTIIVEGGTVNTATYPAADAVIAGYGDSVTLTNGQRYGTSALWLYQYKILAAQRGKRVALKDRGIGGTLVSTLSGSTSGVSRYTDITSLSGVTEVWICYGTNDGADTTQVYQNGGYTTNQAQLGKFVDHGGNTGFEQMLSEIATNMPLGTIIRVVGIYPRGPALHGKGAQADVAAFYNSSYIPRQLLQTWNSAIQTAISGFLGIGTNNQYASYIFYYNPLQPGDPWMLTEVPPSAPVAFSASANGSTSTVVSNTQVTLGHGIMATSGSNAGQWGLVESVSGSGPYTMTVYPAFTASTASGDTFAYADETGYTDAGTVVTASANGSTGTLVSNAVLAVGNDLIATSGTNNGLYTQIIAVSGSGPYTYTVQPALSVATASGDTFNYNSYTRETLHPLIRGARSIALHMVNQVLPVSKRKTISPRGDRNSARHSGGRN